MSEETIKRWRKETQDERTEPSQKRTEPKRTKQSEPNPKKEEISWAEIENDYVTDIRRKPCTLKDLAKKYNIPPQTVSDYAARNKWAKKKKLS